MKSNNPTEKNYLKGLMTNNLLPFSRMKNFCILHFLRTNVCSVLSCVECSGDTTLRVPIERLQLLAYPLLDHFAINLRSETAIRVMGEVYLVTEINIVCELWLLALWWNVQSRRNSTYSIINNLFFPNIGQNWPSLIGLFFDEFTTGSSPYMDEQYSFLYSILIV